MISLSQDAWDVVFDNNPYFKFKKIYTDRQRNPNYDVSSGIFAIDIPGYKRDQIKIEISEGVLYISANNEDRGSLNYHVCLDLNVDAEKITTKLEDGVLTLNLPKTEKAKPRQIAIG